MQQKFNYWVIAGASIILCSTGYYCYLRSHEAINNGVYTTATVCPDHLARHGWKVRADIIFNNMHYYYDPVIAWEHFRFNDTCKTFFVKILDYAPKEGIFIVPRRIAKPDRIRSAPAEGWSEEWMKEHFPKVVEYVHDTR